MNSIEIEHLTKDYGNGKGVFDVSLAIKNKAKFTVIWVPTGGGKIHDYAPPDGFQQTPIRNSEYFGLGVLKQSEGNSRQAGLSAWRDCLSGGHDGHRISEADCENAPHEGLQLWGKAD